MGRHNADSPSSSSGDGIGSVPLDIGFSDPPEKPDLHLRETGFSFADVELVGVTHQDRDHAGAVRAVTVPTGVITLAHEDSVPYLEDERDRLTVLGKIASKHGLSPAGVVLAWNVTNGVVPIPASNTGAHIVDNRAAGTHRLPPEECVRIETLRDPTFER